MRESENITPAMPRRQPEKRVAADDQRQRSCRGFVAQFRERDDRVAWARTFDLACVDLEVRILGECRLDHRKPVRRRRNGRAAMRRVARREQADRCQIECGAHFARELEMSVMDRVERPAQKAECEVLCVRHRGSGNRGRFVQ